MVLLGGNVSARQCCLAAMGAGFGPRRRWRGAGCVYRYSLYPEHFSNFYFIISSNGSEPSYAGGECVTFWLGDNGGRIGTRRRGLMWVCRSTRATRVTLMLLYGNCYSTETVAPRKLSGLCAVLRFVLPFR